MGIREGRAVVGNWRGRVGEQGKTGEGAVGLGKGEEPRGEWEVKGGP